MGVWVYQRRRIGRAFLARGHAMLDRQYPFDAELRPVALGRALGNFGHAVGKCLANEVGCGVDGLTACERRYEANVHVGGEHCVCFNREVREPEGPCADVQTCLGDGLVDCGGMGQLDGGSTAGVGVEKTDRMCVG